jgi:hypothetical protein
MHGITVTNTEITSPLKKIYSEHREKNKGIKLKIDHRIKEFKNACLCDTAFNPTIASQQQTVICNFTMYLLHVSAST